MKNRRLPARSLHRSNEVPASVSRIRIGRLTAILCAATIGAAGHSALAVNAAWNIDAATGNFNTPQWTGGVTVPAAGGTYTVVSGDALYFGTQTTGVTALTNDLVGATYAGLTFNSGASAFTIGGNAFTLSGNLTNNSASLQAINNDITLSTGGKTFAGGVGGLTLGGTSTYAPTTNFSGINFTGTVNSSGTFSTVGGSATAYAGYLSVTGNSTLNVTGGTFNIMTSGLSPADTNSIVGQNAAGTSTMNVNGGHLVVGGITGFALGNNRGDAVGILTVTSGTATITAGSTTATSNRSYVSLGRDSATGTINLNGGTLETDRNFVRDGSGGADASGAANFVFGGGTLKALASQTDWLNSSTKNTNQLALTSVTATGVSTIDSNSFSVAINSAISGTGGFTITDSSGTGTGIVTFGGASTYTGATVVNSGKLALASTGSIGSSASLAINAGAFLDTSAQAAFALSSTQPITFSLDAAGAGSSGQLIAAGLDITNGAVSFSITGTLDDATYVLATYTGLTGTAFASVTGLPSGYTLDYHHNGLNQIALVSAVPEPSAVALMAVGLLGIFLMSRRNQETRVD